MRLILLLTSIIPGFAATLASGYFVLVDWAALDEAHRQFDAIAKAPNRTLEALTIAEAAENRHRINCFAEGVGVLLGGIWMSIGIHSLCSLPRQKS